MRVVPDGGLWGYFAANPAEGRVFSEAMVAIYNVQIAEVLAAHDFTTYAYVADVGGGTGHMLRAILAANAKASGTLFNFQRLSTRRKALAQMNAFSSGQAISSLTHC